MTKNNKTHNKQQTKQNKTNRYFKMQSIKQEEEQQQPMSELEILREKYEVLLSLYEKEK
jgi:hypothetical protein